MTSARLPQPSSFSALQRAENSSTHLERTLTPYRSVVSVLFSEPKIPQRAARFDVRQAEDVSVLFSEPKIPQAIEKMAKDYLEKVSVLFSEPKIPQTSSTLPV